jgi:hypothetical protein
MKVGDRLYCHTNFIILEPFIKEGDYVEVVEVSDFDIMLITNNDKLFILNFEKLSNRYYKKWFYTEKDIRKEKIMRLQS